MGNKSNDQISAAQIQLLELVDHSNSLDIYRALKEVHSLATYHIEDPDLVDLNASRQVQQLIDSIGLICLEKLVSQDIRESKKIE